MLTISGIVSAVSILVVLVISAVVVKQRYDVERDYNNKLDSMAKQVNDTSKSSADYDSKQQKNIENAEKSIQDIRNSYVRKDEMSKNVDTQKVTATNAVFQNTTTTAGVQVTGDNPGPLVEKVYNGDRGNRYGIGNFNKSTTVYAGTKDKDSDIQFAWANSDGTFQKGARLSRKDDKNTRMELDGELVLNNKFALNAYEGEMLRLMDKDNRGLHGGIQVQDIKSDRNATLSNLTLMKGEVRNLFSITGTPSPYNPLKNPTVFNSENQNNVIGGDTTVYGSTNTIGDVKVGSRLFFGDGTPLYMKRDDNVLSLNFKNPAASNDFYSQQWKHGTDVMHEMDSRGRATHKSLKIGNVGIDSSKDAVDINSRWRIGVDDADSMFINQYTPAGATNSYMSLNNGNVGIGIAKPDGKLHVHGGKLTQQSALNGPMWQLHSEGDNGIMGYDGASFSFNSKGTKMMTVDGNAVNIHGEAMFAKNVNVAGSANATNMWVDDKVGFGKTPSGTLAVMNKQKELSSLEMKDFKTDYGRVGSDGLLVEGDINTDSGLKVKNSTVLKGDLHVNGQSTFDGNVKFRNGSYISDGDVHLKSASDKSVTIGANDNTMVFGPSDIRIGKNNAIEVGSDGTTRIRSAKPNSTVSIGVDAPKSVNIGEEAEGNYIGAKSRTNQVGSSYFPAADGHVYIRPAQAKKDINIGSDFDVANINIGNNETKVNVRDRLCVNDSCVNDSDIRNIYKIPGIEKHATMSISANDVSNIKEGLPRVMNAPYNQLQSDNVDILKNINSGDLSYIKNLGSIYANPAVTGFSSSDVNSLKQLQEIPAKQLSGQDVTNVKSIPNIVQHPTFSMNANDIAYVKNIPNIPAFSMSAQDVVNVRNMTNIPAYSLNAQDVTNVRNIANVPANTLNQNDVDNIKMIPDIMSQLQQLSQPVRLSPAPY